jgi:mannose-6-phosphate isomerase-like protein (cupin superfamily)
MTNKMPSGALPCGREREEEWSEITPGVRYIVRASSDETNGAYAILEVFADHRNGTLKHVHQNEDEHLIILEGKAHIANGDQRVNLAAGSALTVRRGVVHAWCNLSETPLRMLVIFTPGGIDEMYRETARGGDLDILAPTLEKFGCRIVGSALFDDIYSKASPRS